MGVIAISLHILQLQGGGGYSVVVKTQSAKICLNFNLGEGGGILAESKLKLPRSGQLFISKGGGGSILEQARIPYSCQNEQKFCHASHILEGLASQIVSHILHMWRLIINTHSHTHRITHI